MQTVVLVDDHVLLRNGLASLVESFGGYKILFEANNGQHFIEKLQPAALPDIVLMDINMPAMDGFQTSAWLKEHHPGVKILALSINTDERSIIRMFKEGARGYILKDCDPAELRVALHAIATKGYYYTEMITETLLHSVNSAHDHTPDLNHKVKLNDREAEFLKLVCTELTYKEIAEKMYLSPRTIDGYREELFVKLNVKTRTGLVMYAIRNGYTDL